MDSFPVRFDTTKLADDPELHKLLADFSNARVALSSYLNRAMDLTLKAESDKEEQFTPC